MSAPAANNQRPNQAPQRSGGSERPKPRGPVAALVALALAFLASVVTSVFLGTVLEIIGLYTLWPAEGVAHAKSHVAEDLAYIQQFPRSVLVADTVGFAQNMALWARWPLDKLAVPQLIARAAAVDPNVSTDPKAGKNAIFKLMRRGYIELIRWVEVFYHVLQDTAIRLSVALFATPAFLLAMLVGLVDGLVKRDLRKWCGGRESSFVYHHAKQFAGWSLTGGFALYLAWPFRGFNPTYMVLVFTVLVAATLSLTVSSFKKYL